MATRFYFPIGTGAPAAPVTTIAPSSNWDIPNPTGFARQMLVTTKQNTTLTAETSTQYAETGTTVGNLCHKQYVGDIMVVDQTISGTFTLVLRCGEGSTGGTNANADMSLQCIVRVIKSDGTERGVLYGGHTTALNQASGAVGQEMATTTQVRLMNGVTLNPVDCLAGDRLVVEIGARHHNTLSGTYWSYLHLGDLNGSDHPLSTTTSALPGWFELSQDVSTRGDGTGSTSATSGVTQAGIKVAKGTLTIPDATAVLSAITQKKDYIVAIQCNGTAGTAVSTSNSPFSTVSAGGTGASLTYRDNGKALGYIENAITTTSTSSTMTYTFPTGKSSNIVYGRMYMRFYSLPTGSGMQLTRLRTGSSTYHLIRLTTAGKIELHNGTASLAVGTANVALNAWVRVEYIFNGPAGTQTLKLYNDPDSMYPTETLTGAASNQTIDSFQVGILNAYTNMKVDFDEIKMSAIGMPTSYVTPRVNGSGTVSGLAQFAKSGMKRAISAGWGIQGFSGSLVSTGSKGYDIAAGDGTVATTGSISSSGKKVAKVTGTVSGTGSLTPAGKKVAKVTGTISNTSPANLKAGAESGTLTGFGDTLNAAATSSAAHDGSYGYRVDTTAAGGYLNWTNTDVEQSHAWASVSAWVRVNSHSGAESTDLITVKNNAGVNHFDLFLTTDNRFKWDLLISDQQQTAIMALGSWHYIECRVYFGATTYTAQVRIDGVDYGTISSVSQTVSTARSIWFGTSNAKTHQIDFDDLKARVADTDPGYIPHSLANDGKKVARTGDLVLTGSVGAAGGTGKKSAGGSVTIAGFAGMAPLGKKVAKGQPALALTAVTTTLGSSGTKGKVFVTGSMGGTGALTSTGRKVAKGANLISGTVSTPTSGAKRAFGIGELNAFHSLTSSGGRNTNYAQGTGSVNGTTSSSSTGKKVAKVTGTITGLAIFAKSGKKVARGSVSISAVVSGPDASISLKVAKGAVTIAGAVGAAGVGSKNAQAGESIVNGFVTAIATGRKSTGGTGMVTNAGGLTAAGIKDVRGTGFVAGFASLTSTGHSVQISQGTGQINSNGNLTAAPGKKYVGGDAQINHVAVFADNGRKVAKGLGSYSGVGTVSGVGGKGGRGPGSVAGVSSLAAVGRKVGKGSSVLSAFSALTPEYGRHTARKGSGALTAAGAMSASGHHRNPRNPIRIGGKSGAVLVGSNIGLAIPLGGYSYDD